MNRGLTGSYTTSVFAGEKVSAFIPYALPPNPPLDLSLSRQRALERAHLACGRLDGISALLPDPNLFLYGYVRREAVLSSQIEGTQSSLSDLLMFEINEVPGVPTDDVIEVSNYVAALEHGMSRLAGDFPLSNRLLREMHQLLLARGRGSDKQPGAFRRSQNWIGGTRPGNAHFVPPPPEAVEGCMSQLEQFIHGQENGLPTLIKAALAHVQFETIHPFLDGNGRIGRLLIALILHDQGVLRQPLLYLSLYFKRYRDRYYQLLDGVRTDGDWEAWLDFFLEGVEQTANGAVETAHRLLAIFREHDDQVQVFGRSTANALRMLQILRVRPVATLTDLSERAGVSYPTAAKIIEMLREIGIVREMTGRRRDRLFAYDQYVRILTEGTEVS